MDSLETAEMNMNNRHQSELLCKMQADQFSIVLYCIFVQFDLMVHRHGMISMCCYAPQATHQLTKHMIKQ